MPGRKLPAVLLAAAPVVVDGMTRPPDWLKPWLDDWPLYVAGLVIVTVLMLSVYRGLVLFSALASVAGIALLFYSIRLDRRR